MAAETITERIRIPTADGPMSTYIARPARPRGRVIVGHQLFGVTADVTAIADRLAGLGLLAVAPEFYHRCEDGIVLDADERGRARGFELLEQVTRQTFDADLDAVFAWLDGQVAGATAMIGVSVGGHFAYYAATRYSLDLTVALYPTFLTDDTIALGTPRPTLELTSGIEGRLLMVVGERDQFVTADQRQVIAAELEAAGVSHEFVVIPGAAHAFLNCEGPAYDSEATELAWSRIEPALARLFGENVGS